MSLRHLLAAALAALSFQALAAVDVNKATQSEMQGIKGIGPSLSAKILEARKTGEFKNWTDLVERVGGIGPGNASRFSQAGLTVRGAAYPGSGAAQPGKGAAPAGKGAAPAATAAKPGAPKSDAAVKPRG